jgi:hypothetical protein
MKALCRTLFACAFATLPALCPGAAATAPADGGIGYGFNGGASVAAGTMAAARSVHLGGDAAIARGDSVWRLGGKALWSRTVTDTAAENVTVLLMQESRHRWSRRTWFWQRLSVAPGMRAGDNTHASLDTGLAISLTRLLHLDFGLTQQFDGAAGGQTRFVTGIAMKLD